MILCVHGIVHAGAFDVENLKQSITKLLRGFDVENLKQTLKK